MSFVVIPYSYVDLGTKSSGLPSCIFGGDRVQWAVVVTGHSSQESYAVEWHFQGAVQQVAYSAARSDGSHLLELSSAQTSAMTAGDYTWQAIVTGNDVRQTVATGEVEIKQALADYAPGVAVDLRSDAKIALDAIDASLLGKATKDVAEYQLRGRSLKRYSTEELLRLRGLYAEQVRKEEVAQKYALGKPGAGKVRVHFR